MASSVGRADMRVLSLVRCSRALLLRSTALQAAVLTVIALPQPGMAQPAPNARPTGGQVVAGSAQISQPNAATTVITQSTDRAAVNWTSFSVGAKQSVDFVQPSASSMTLNRVTGPDPSAIAGQIHANGGVVLTNPNGVVFYKGSQVNAQNVIVSTAGITNQNFMAGKLVFDQPGSVNARVDNAGTITVAQTGLAALVAPQVANSGVISAKLGKVVLAGAQAAVLDMYGDGLLSVDVTKQVTTAPVGSNGKPATALVTNTGTMIADGGQVVITAAAADGVVQNLVSAGGSIRADSVGGKLGSIAIAGTGGSIVISGNLAARGMAAGSTGGTIELNASQAVTVASSARVNASGQAGGGTVAVGTTLARAVGGPGVAPAMTAATTTVAKGAKITANAVQKGNGGRVTVLSTSNTVMSGSVQAKGGKTAGNGGTVEVSTGGSLLLDGEVDVTAPHGRLGDINLDPYDLTIASSTPTPTALTDNTNPNLAYNAGGTTIGNNATITPAQLTALHGNIHLQAVDDINVTTSVTLATVGQGFTLEAGNNLTVSGGSTISTAGSIALLAASSGIPGFNAGGTLEVIGSLISSGGGILLQGGTGGVVLAGQVSAPAGGLVDIKSDILSILTAGQASSLGGGAGGFVVAAGGQVTVEPYTFGHPVELIGTATTAAANTLSVSTSELALINTATLALDTQLVVGNSSTVSGALAIGRGNDPVSLGTIGQLSLFASTITQGAPLTVGTLSGQTGTVVLTNASNQIGTISNLTANALSLQDAIPLTLAGSDFISGSATIGDTASLLITGQLGVIGTLALNVSGAVSETTGSIVDLGSPLTLTGSAGTLALSNFNTIDTLGAFTTTGGGLAIADRAAALSVAGPVLVSGGTLALSNTLGSITLLGSINAPSVSLTASANIAQTAGTLSTGTLSATGTDLSFNDPNTVTNIGSLVATSGFASLVDRTDLGVLGTVTGATGIGLTTTGNLTLTGGLATPTTASTTLVAGGTISELGGGVIVTGTLNGSATRGAFLSQPNEIGNIGNFSSNGGFLLVQDTTPLAVTGSLADSTAITLSTQGPITLAGTVAAPLVTIATTETFAPLNSGTTPVNASQLAAVESIIQTGGAISAGTLAVTAAAGVNLLPGVNTIANLGTIKAATLFNLSNTGSITVAGPATVTGPTINAGAGNDFYYQFYIATTGDITIGAPVSGAVVGLFPTGALNETAGGSITASFLQGSAATINLGQVANAIGEIDLLTSSGDLTLADGIPLTINGQVSAGSANTLTIDNDQLNLAANAALSANVIDLAPLNPGDAFGVGNAGGLASLKAITANTLILGSATAGTVTVNTAGSAFDTSGVGTLSLVSGAAVVETGQFGIIANQLNGNAASANLPAANVISSVGSFATTGAFLLTTANPATTPLTIFGPLSGSNVTVNATSPIAISGQVAAGVLSLVSAGGVSETAGETGVGSINATTLNATETTGGTIALTGSNSIINIGTVSAGTGSFLLTDFADLTVAGGISATGSIGILSSGSITLAGPVGGAGAAISLTATGAIAETAAGVLTSGQLDAAGTNITLGNAQNVVVTLGTVSASGSLSVVDSQALTVIGPVDAPLTSLLVNSGSLGLVGDVSASTQMSLVANGAIIQSAGSIATPLLTGQSGGAVVLGGANSIASVGSLSATGVSLNDTAALSIAGPLTAGAGNVTLTVAGNLTETAGGSIVTGGTLSGSAASVGLTGGNQIASLGTFAGIDHFAIVDTVPLTVAGLVSVGTASSTSISITDNNPGFSGAGALSAPNGAILFAPTGVGSTLTLGGSGGAPSTAISVVIGSPSGGPVSITGPLNFSGVQTVFLQSAGAIAESGAGAVNAPLVLGTAASVQLGGPNTIAALGSFATTGAFALNDTANLALTGVLSATSATLVTGGTLSEGAAGVISAGTLAGGANAAILSGSNTIASVGAFTVTNGLTLNDTAALDIAGTLTGGSVSLTTGGTLTESTGVIVAGTLAGSATGANLSGQNVISALGTLSVPGGLVLLDTTPLSITGAVRTGPFAIIDSSSAVSETASGNIVATTLNIAGSTLALSGDNDVGTLALAAAAGGVSFANVTDLIVTGPVGGAGATTLAVRGDIAVNGSLSGSSVTLTANGAIGENAAGTIATGLLIASGTTIALAGTNAIAALGTVTAEFVTLADGVSLDIAGPVRVTDVALSVGGALTESTGLISAGSLAASAASISLGGSNAIPVVGNLIATGSLAFNDTVDVALNAPISGSSVALTTTGFLSGSGVVTAGTLSVAAIQALLTGANSVGTLAAASTGGLTLDTTTPLVVAGPVTSTFLTLASPGAITITGPVSATNATLAAGGAVSESGAGAITAPILTGTAGSASLGGANAIATLGTFSTVGTTTGILAFNDIQALTVAGPVSGGGISLTDGAAITIAGNVNAGAANTLNVSAGGALNQTGGVITAGTLTGGAGSANLGGGNAIGVLGAFGSPGLVALTDTVPLTIAGPISVGALSVTDSAAIALTGGLSAGSLTINSGGSIVQSDGTITVGLLTGSAVGRAVFGPDDPAPVANIGTLGAFTVSGGTLSVASGQAMTVTGPLNAGSLAVSAPGTLTLAGGTITTAGGTIAVTQGTATGSGTAQLVQTGTTTVTTPTGSTLVFQLPGSGAMTFADLEATATSVVLETGNGTATGLVNVGALSVFGQTGGVTLTGSAGGITGPNAALGSSISPAVDTNYTLNGCVIAAATCGVIVMPPIQPVVTPQVGVIVSTILPPNAGISVLPGGADTLDQAGSTRSAFRVPFLSGLLSFIFSRDVEDPDLVLPNISDRDY